MTTKATTNKFSPEVRERAVRMVLDHAGEYPAADDEAVAGIAAAQPFDRPARAHARRVGVDQQGQQHLRRERRLPRVAQPVAGLEPAQVHHPHRVDDQMDDVALRQPVHHVSRKQEGLTSFRFAKMMRHRSVRAVEGRRSNRASPSPSTPKRTKTRHHDVPEGDCATGTLQVVKEISEMAVDHVRFLQRCHVRCVGDHVHPRARDVLLQHPRRRRR